MKMKQTENSLGQRIISHRKRLGMTQDQLAERVGVSAQAVSKWENDLSCPDISILPKLAEIFGTSTDELLGCGAKPAADPVYQGEVVEDEPQTEKERNFQFKYGDFVLEMDGHRHNLVFAAFIIALGGLLLANTLAKWHLGFWALAWPTAMLFFGVGCLVKRVGLFGISLTLGGGYFLLSNIGVLPEELGGNLIWPLLILIWGVSLFFDSLWNKRRKQKKRNLHWNGSVDSRVSYQNGMANVDLSFDSQRTQWSASPFHGGRVDVSFGSYELNLADCTAIGENCQLAVDLSFGSMRLLVPRRYAVELATDKAFSSVNVQGAPTETPEGMIHLNVDVSFANLTVIYI